MSASPKSPFDRWPTRYFDSLYGYAWYCGGGLIVSHLTVHRGTAAGALSYHAFERAVLRDHAEDVAASGGLFVIHDWRAMSSYETEARLVWQGQMQNRSRGYLRGSVVCIARASALLKMAIQAANLVATIHHGARVELTSDLGAALASQGVWPHAVAGQA